MKELYLEVTYRSGRPIAAYLCLPRKLGDRSHRTAKAPPGLVIDFDRRSQPIGIEITAPRQATLAHLNSVLSKYGFPLLESSDLEPLRAA